MPSSISQLTAEIRCLACDKLLATPEGIKCPRCKKVHSFEQCFATALRPDQYQVVFLWAPDGSRGSPIVIRKEIWLNVGGLQGVPKDRLQYPVFFVFDPFDSSKTFGCQVNDEPILDFREALRLAREHELAARGSGKWVDLDKVKKHELQKPESGIWTFLDLERLSKVGKASYTDLLATLGSYCTGASVLPRVVIGIIARLGPLSSSERSELRSLAELGARNTHGRALEEWGVLVRHLS